ncbi:MAG: leucine-rich repeat domain-containing protein [Candidatus Peribacteria bacterium]|jgi:hypothetical protein|nr:leucine-rich repeat domain-containing protein [Candidatus Peribacteria bacterium]
MLNIQPSSILTTGNDLIWEWRATENGQNKCITLTRNANGPTSLDWGDGTPVEHATITTTATQICHTYAKNGIYEVHITTPVEITSIDLSNQWVTDFFLGSGSNITTLNINHNHIVSLHAEAFAHPNSKIAIDIGNNPLYALPTTIFSAIVGAMTIRMDHTCSNIQPPQSATQGSLTRRICASINYTPSTTTSQPVVGSIEFIGGDALQRALLESQLPITYTWKKNGEYTFDLSSLNGSGTLLYTKIIGIVDRINAGETEDPIVWEWRDSINPQKCVTMTGNAVGTVSLDWGDGTSIEQSNVNPITATKVCHMYAKSKETIHEVTLQNPGILSALDLSNQNVLSFE